MTDKNRRMAERLWIPWHEMTPEYNVDKTSLEWWNCSCGFKGLGRTDEGWSHDTTNPDFSDDAGAVALLRLMMEREGKWRVWLRRLMVQRPVPPEEQMAYYITTRGALLDAALEWFEKEREGL